MQDERSQCVAESEPVCVADRRSSQRYDVCWPVRFAAANGVLCDGVCINVNEAGFRFRSRSLVAVGRVIDVAFPAGASDAQPHSPVRARIIYRMGEEYGATFISAPEIGMTGAANG
jgi:hypothetical protein